MPLYTLYTYTIYLSACTMSFSMAAKQARWSSVGEYWKEDWKALYACRTKSIHVGQSV